LETGKVKPISPILLMVMDGLSSYVYFMLKLMSYLFHMAIKRAEVYLVHANSFTLSKVIHKGHGAK